MKIIKIVGMFLLAIIIMVISQTIALLFDTLMELEQFYRVSLIFYLHFSS